MEVENQLNDLNLIGLVQASPHIYDKRRGDFKDADKRAQTWCEISDTLGVSVNDCQTRWRYLREKYGKERNKYNGSSKKVKWDLYEHLTWIDPFIISRKKNPTTIASHNDLDIIEYLPVANSCSETEENEMVIPDLKRCYSSSEDHDDYSSQFQYADFEIENENESKLSIDTVTSFIDTAYTEQKYKKQKSSNSSSKSDTKPIQITNNVKRESCGETGNSQECHDEDLLFGQQVTVFLKKLKHKQRKRDFKRQVFNMMMDVESDSDDEPRYSST